MSNEPRTKIAQVVGLTFVDEYPINVLAITERQPATLWRNPRNPYDANAIEVHSANGMIGHIDKALAARMAPFMDEGTHKITAELLPARVNPDHEDRPGISVHLTSVRLAEVNA